MIRRGAARGTVWAMWHGGTNYGAGEYPRDVETFPSRTAARDALRDRATMGHGWAQTFTYADGRRESTLTPCADSGAYMTVWTSDPRGTDDPYPDFVYELTESGAVRQVRA